MKLSVLDEHRSLQFTHYDSSLQLQIMQQFNECRQTNRFIDLEVEVEGVIFPCHKILLDGFCPYFTAYFSFSEMSIGEKKEEGSYERNPVEKVSLKYNGVTVIGFSKLLEFMYTAELEVTKDDVIDVLRCADFLQFHQVVHLCSAFLQQHITTDTCLQILVLAQAHDLHDLAEKAFRYTLTNMESVLHCPEFMQLSKEILVKIISSDYLEIETEAVVVEAILTWASFEDRIRKSLVVVPELLNHARLHYVDLKQMEKVLSKSYVFTDQENTAIKRSMLDKLTQLPSLNRLTEVLIVVCRETQRKHRGVIRNMSTLYYYDPEALRWETLTQLPFDDRQDYSAMVVGNSLFLTGGHSIDIHDIYSTRIVFNDHWAYDPITDSWMEKKSMNVPRYNHSAAAMHEKLYVVGGRATSSCYSLRGDGEMYDPSSNQWTIISPLRCIEGIGNAALTSFDGKLYLCGGTYFTPIRQSQVPYEIYQGAQVYNPQSDEWQEHALLEREITRRKVRVHRGSMVTVEGFLLFLDDDVGKSHLLYNPVSQSFTQLIQAHGHHWFAGWAMYQGQLVCTGGVEDGSVGMTDMVHMWDLTNQSQRWVMMPPLPRPMSHHACLALHLNLPRPGTEDQA